MPAPPASPGTPEAPGPAELPGVPLDGDATGMQPATEQQGPASCAMCRRGLPGPAPGRRRCVAPLSSGLGSLPTPSLAPPPLNPPHAPDLAHHFIRSVPCHKQIALKTLAEPLCFLPGK